MAAGDLFSARHFFVPKSRALNGGVEVGGRSILALLGAEFPADEGDVLQEARREVVGLWHIGSEPAVPSRDELY
ncbi:MAG TPA: hypothetical protein VKE70_03770 [Candidatus Solibacter sp.]|nr:hypothetical protein [Candidatus Solibacter sp.]